MELLWRSFFQEAEEDGGMNRRFKMHDLIHDLAQYVSGTDFSLVCNDSPPRFSHSNSIMPIFSPARSQPDISENYENFPNLSIMPIFSPARSQPDISENYENFSNPSIMPIFSPAISETDSGSESNETPPQFSYPMMSIFPPIRSQTYNFRNYGDIMLDLKLSYDHLPLHLKCCFAYCSLFLKNYLIDKVTLIKLWIAQGFIQSPDENLPLVDVANEYFMELLWRSFFQEAEEDGGMNRRFEMHDLIHDLAQYVSGTD